MLCVIGLNHKNSSLEERERFAVQKPEVGFTARYFLDRLGLSECVLLSTCNRFELYCALGSKNRAKTVAAGIVEYFKTGPAPAGPSRFYSLFGADAARHLFSVASGLDSMVVGEPQILSQVKHAYSSASEAKTTGYLLNKLFHQAIKAGKAARSETAIGGGSVSVSGAAVAAVKKERGSLAGLSALLVGSGETAELALDCLIRGGIGQSAVISRTLEHAEALASRYGAAAYDLSSLYERVCGYDIVISSTDSPHYVIGYEKYAAASKSSARRRAAARHSASPAGPRIIIDLAVPRDVDPRISELDGVRLFNIDDLAAMAVSVASARKKEALKAAKIVEAETAIFLDWYEGRSVKPFIEKFRAGIEKIVGTEVDKFARKLPPAVKEWAGSLEALKQAIINRICAAPISRARGCSQKSRIHDCINTFECFFGEECASGCSAAENNSTGCGKIKRRR